MCTPRDRSSVAVGRPMSVEIDHSERKLSAALRTATRSATKPEHCPAAENLRRDIARRRIKPVTHILTVLRDAFERGSSESDVQAFARELTAEIAGWYKAERGEVSWRPAWDNEEAEEHTREDAERAFEYDPSPANAVRLMDAIHRHQAATVPLLECASRRLAGVH